MTGTIRVPINSDVDIVKARQSGREAAAQAGFSLTDMSLIATAISELARNILRYAKHGEVVISHDDNSGKRGIVVVARDEGPGIRSIEQALQVGFSTSGGLGLGLPGVRRLTDEFEISSKPGRGTVVTIKKWRA
ncbi:MAG TPA: anti-sigma regulatory factor [Terriglobia bacterium]|nr:anti-sigma regulatory factor [Terriglobia bacterium]